jgi:hypothetical protein
MTTFSSLVRELCSSVPLATCWMVTLISPAMRLTSAAVSDTRWLPLLTRSAPLRTDAVVC